MFLLALLASKGGFYGPHYHLKSGILWNYFSLSAFDFSHRIILFAMRKKSTNKIFIKSVFMEDRIRGKLDLKDENDTCFNLK